MGKLRGQLSFPLFIVEQHAIVWTQRYYATFSKGQVPNGFTILQSITLNCKKIAFQIQLVTTLKTRYQKISTHLKIKIEYHQTVK